MTEAFSFVTGVAGLFVGVVGVILSVYYNRKARYAERARTFYDWPLLQTAARELARRLNAHKALWGMTARFNPEGTQIGETETTYKDVLILGIQGGGVIFGQLLIFEINEEIPLRVVHVIPRGHRIRSDVRVTHDLRQTTKFDIWTPKELKTFDRRQVIVVDDCATTGHSLSETKAALRDMGFTDVDTVAAVCCTSAINARNAPEFYWSASESDDVYFPWGSGRRLQRFAEAN
jgi:hypoxanthine-guanine phosphoribosyltransferase